jgi:DEAD/DEAH box helicase domain-containing protein
LKFSCPKCKSRLEIQKTFNKKIHISCDSCGIEDLLEFSKNIDEVFLEFLSRFDEGLVTKKGVSKGLKDEGIIRDEKEIKEMIGKNNPDKITESVLFSKKDYVSQYKVLKNPEPKMGSNVEDLGLDESISNHLKEIGIEQFYKFQEESIEEISFGENVVIEAPTASGKTEAFLIPVIQKIKKESSDTKGVFAVFVYPTKALSRDQHPKILKFAEKIGIDIQVFDGDTNQTSTHTNYKF